MDQDSKGGGAIQSDSLLAPIKLEQQFADWVELVLVENVGASDAALPWIKLGVLVALVSILCVIAWWIARVVLLNLVASFAERTKSTWDDHLVKRKFFRAAASLLPVMILSASLPVVFVDFAESAPIFDGLVNALGVIVCIRIILAFLNAFTDILLEKPALADKPIGSYFQLAKIVVWIMGGVLLFSVLFHKSPLYFLSAMGAMTAVLLLIFKDTILGFVASIQIAVNDMVRVGDWVTMPQYGADGDVLEINLTTVKVTNFDKTITTIPTYHFISDSFKNWRGMTDSGGRRIKRGLKIRVSSIKYCDDEMVERFSRIEYISDYITERQAEIDAYNIGTGLDLSLTLNGRNLTNIGVFRAYAEAYLKSNPHLNHELTTMVRQLEATEKGVALEIYCFSAVKDWVPYETIQGDIFDHLLAAVPWFDLEVFEDWGNAKSVN